MSKTDLSKLTKAELVALLASVSDNTESTEIREEYPHITAAWVKPNELHVIIKDYGNRKAKTNNHKHDWMYRSENEGFKAPNGKNSPFVILDAKSPSGKVTGIQLNVIEYAPK